MKTRKNYKYKENRKKKQFGGGVFSKLNLSTVKLNNVNTSTNKKNTNISIIGAGAGAGAGASASTSISTLTSSATNVGNKESVIPITSTQFNSILLSKDGYKPKNNGIFSSQEKDVLSQVFFLREEAFPNEYSRNIIKNAEKHPHLLYESAIHCEKSEKPNIIFILSYKENNKLNVLSSAAVNWCNLSGDYKLFELFGVATFKKYQGMGYAKKLLEHTLAQISQIMPATKNKPIKRIIWLYYERNKPYLGKFYGQFGFKELTEKEAAEDSILNKIYISRKYLLDRMLGQKLDEYKRQKEQQRYSRGIFHRLNKKDFTTLTKQEEEAALEFINTNEQMYLILDS